MNRISEGRDLDYSLANLYGVPDDMSETWSLVYSPSSSKPYVLAMTRKIYNINNVASATVHHAFIDKPRVILFYNDDKPVTDVEYELTILSDEVIIDFAQNFTGYALLT